jgi:hypothetical protein
MGLKLTAGADDDLTTTDLSKQNSPPPAPPPPPPANSANRKTGGPTHSSARIPPRRARPRLARARNDTKRVNAAPLQHDVASGRWLEPSR